MTGVYDAYASRLGYDNIKLQTEDEMNRELFAEYVEVKTDPEKAEKELGWKAIKTLEDMCADTWNWQAKNPNGYEK